ncbi:MAG TPA: ABC transporter ATP-binding protein [Verrucomicrobiae bacterium]|nr:ABC transporter ATP-binding protein [Verrucomicrobiae bacterium]
MKNKTDDTDLTFKRRLSIGLRMLRICWNIRRASIVGYFVGALVEVGGTIASIYATAKLGSLLALFVATGQTQNIWLWLWVDITAVVVIGIGFWIMGYCKRMLYFSLVQWSINSFLKSVSKFDLGSFYETSTRNQLNKISGAYIWQLPNLSDACLELIYGLIRFLAITAVVSQITWWLVPLIALFLIPSLIGESRMAKMQWFVWDSKGDFRHIFWGLEYIIRQAKGQMELRTSQASSFVLNKIDTMNQGFYREQEGKYRKASRSLMLTKVLEAGGTATGAVILLKQFLSHAISLERYFFLSGALLRIGGALNSIFGTLTRMQEGLLFADSYFSLVDAQPRIVDPPNAIALPAGATPSIVFKDVSFTYPDQTEPIFENLNIEIKSGEHVALVGENGAGKSTLIKLLLRFYQPTSGQILVDGQDLQEVAIETWYAQLATLFQDFNHYPLSIAENIEIGRSTQKANRKQLEQAAAFGNVDEMVKGYAHGWDTVLDSSFKKGVEPSGGQWQRVALARAFYRNADMIILDEPTSAIDAKAEYDIFNNIFDHYQDKTALIVSHRFSTVRRANRIIVIDHGKIVEQGSHQALMKKKGLYHELFSKQAEGYR